MSVYRTIGPLVTFISRINYRFWHSKPSISIYLGYFGIYEQVKFYAQLITLGPGYSCLWPSNPLNPESNTLTTRPPSSSLANVFLIVDI